MDQFQAKYIKAGDPTTPAEELWALAGDNIDNIRRRVAENPAASLALLQTLAKDECPEVKMAIAENPQTPLGLLECLAEDEQADVRYAIAENPNMPISLLLRLTDDANPYISHRAQRTLRILNPVSATEINLHTRGYVWRQAGSS